MLLKPPDPTSLTPSILNLVYWATIVLDPRLKESNYGNNNPSEVFLSYPVVRNGASAIAERVYLKTGIATDRFFV